MTNGNFRNGAEVIARVAEIPVPMAYRLVADERTAAAIDVLRSERPLELDALARGVARRESPDRPEAVLESVRLSLVHVVLPKLDAHDVLTYDREGKRIVADSLEVLADDPCEETVSPNPSS